MGEALCAATPLIEEPVTATFTTFVGFSSVLNGRRLAANAYDSGVTNLNIIPLAMLDRIEVLRDGAS
ncbi:hypothetical protein IAG06_16415, partial [Acinetobacter baumannii]